VKWQELVGFIKAFNGARFNGATKKWTIPNTEENRQMVKIRGFALKAPVSESKTLYPKRTPSWMFYEFEEPPHNWLRPYQIEGMRLLCQRGDKGALILAEPGLGKTPLAIAYIDYTKTSKTLIVATALTKKQWQERFDQFTPGKKIHIIYGETPYELPNADIYIINWDILGDWVGHKQPCFSKEEPTKVVAERFVGDGPLCNIGLKLVIADEAQAIGNETSIRYKALREVCKASGRRPVLLTGTPMNTRPDQFWTLLNLVAPDIFPNHMKFRSEFCAPSVGSFGVRYDGAENMDKLHYMIQPISARHLKKDVMNDLPEKTVSVLPVEIDLDSYHKIEEKAFARDGRTMEQIKRDVAELQRSSFMFKRKACVDTIADFLNNHPNEKAVVFAWHKDVVQLLATDLDKYAPAVVNSTVTGKDREIEMKRFREDPQCRLIIGNIKALGVGVDGLQGVTSYGFFVEFGSAPGDHDQAESRLWRSGQYLPVFWTYIIARGTIDDDNMAKLDQRRKNISLGLDGMANEEEFLLSLLKKHLKFV
jgi:SWI/SNF-related matrix-associated actin-dependent regulator 1 of chromatin subfamily A